MQKKVIKYFKKTSWAYHAAPSIRANVLNEIGEIHKFLATIFGGIYFFPPVLLDVPLFQQKTINGNFHHRDNSVEFSKLM